MEISHIQVHWSESPLFPGIDQDYSVTEFESKALRAAMGHRTGGYLKTKISVFFEGEEHPPMTTRIDLAEHDEHGLADYVNQRLTYYHGQPDSPTVKARLIHLEKLQQAIANHETS